MINPKELPEGWIPRNLYTYTNLHAMNYQQIKDIATGFCLDSFATKQQMIQEILEYLNDLNEVPRD